MLYKNWPLKMKNSQVKTRFNPMSVTAHWKSRGPEVKNWWGIQPKRLTEVRQKEGWKEESCLVRAVLFWQSCPLFPILDVLSRLFYGSPVCCPVLAVVSQLSCLSNLVSDSTDAAALSLLSCPALSSLFYPGSSVQADLSWLARLSCPELVVLS